VSLDNSFSVLKQILFEVDYLVLVFFELREGAFRVQFPAEVNIFFVFSFLKAIQHPT